ncbi:hypothetical protein JGI14_101135 [Candidatus Kryptonium thompsonii]|uniref:Uncharacterized protein n=1 Tax=Candidatus Kryptonium thompsonii TaxID=1633631 RepID=A0A0P1P373_9BACT|nr:hypothetical protein [Candidatus Kryptonium thompsoni]CUS78478.1 hypothetical protein JGI15_100353 [Candidatus Kryptonium thompsoni]CUS80816.1 hypothetical protein JGI13_00596 [Candidatus Kryptonium thompsoni]CUS81490.1 hypothetical protein JGI6_00008 [Candidatus Kryptonium thompsoni]CUS81991.1 hypothetical protein JGI14_101135 [Candidatus Kryptonium thompsoni]CUS84090.1 hypothetical protein JGI10_00974 [Candidatus Kryptonium thompsoni]
MERVSISLIDSGSGRSITSSRIDGCWEIIGVVKVLNDAEVRWL